MLIDILHVAPVALALEDQALDRGDGASPGCCSLGDDDLLEPPDLGDIADEQQGCLYIIRVIDTAPERAYLVHGEGRQGL